jgi:ABC-type proline/glycine betaine transport system permease subunit
MNTMQSTGLDAARPRERGNEETIRAIWRFLHRHPGVARLGVVILIFLAWEISARWFMDPLFVSPPSRVFTSLRSVWDTSGVPAAVGITFFELAVAFAIAVTVGLVVGLAIGLQPFARRSLMPIVLLVYGLPQITILPLFILLFGIGAASKIAFGVTHGVFPIVITVVAGVQNLKPILLTSARSMGASRWHILRWVIFPHSACCSPSFTCRPPASAISPRCSPKISIRPSYSDSSPCSPPWRSCSTRSCAAPKSISAAGDRRNTKWRS